MEHYTLLIRQLFSTPYYEKDNIFVHFYCQKGWGVIKVCTVYYSTAVYSTVLCFTVLYYKGYIFFCLTALFCNIVKDLMFLLQG